MNPTSNEPLSIDISNLGPHYKIPRSPSQTSTFVTLYDRGTTTPCPKAGFCSVRVLNIAPIQSQRQNPRCSLTFPFYPRITYDQHIRGCPPNLATYLLLRGKRHHFPSSWLLLVIIMAEGGLKGAHKRHLTGECGLQLVASCWNKGSFCPL